MQYTAIILSWPISKYLTVSIDGDALGANQNSWVHSSGIIIAQHNIENNMVTCNPNLKLQTQRGLRAAFFTDSFECGIFSF